MDNSNKNKTVKPNPEQRRPTQQGGEGGRPAQSEQSQGDHKESDRRRDKRDIDSDRRQHGETGWNDGNR
jgi:hypothetical protein